MKWMQPCRFVLTGSLAWRWFFHFCHEFLQVSTAKPLPAKTQSSSSGWLKPDHQDSSGCESEGGKAKHCNSEKQKHLSTASDGFWFRSCINVFHEPENQHDVISKKHQRLCFASYLCLSIQILSLGCMCFQCPPGCGVWGTQIHTCMRFSFKGGIVHRLAVKWGH